jgi:hypothetical protein
VKLPTSVARRIIAEAPLLTMTSPMAIVIVVIVLPWISHILILNLVDTICDNMIFGIKG